MDWLSLFCGMAVGLSLGLTGGGGAIFAIPLLVYVVGVSPRDAVGISLVSVGATAIAGCVARWRRNEVELPTGLLFALAGMAGAPLGAAISQRLPEQWLLPLFAGVMIAVAVTMWRRASAADQPLVTHDAETHCDAPTCQRDASGRLRLTTRCAVLLLAIGVFSGVFSGLFGVGGGFIIVPALMVFSGISLPRAVGTSLFVISFVSAAGAVTQFLHPSLPADRDGITAYSAPMFEIAAPFAGGGIVGMFLGQWASHRFRGASLQRAFAVLIVFVAVFVLLRSQG